MNIFARITTVATAFLTCIFAVTVNADEGVAANTIDPIPPAQPGPHKAFVAVTPHNAAEASYLTNWIQRLEEAGTKHYASNDQGQHLYGSLTLTVEIHRDGSMGGVTIEHSSGNAALDDATIEILKSIAPFAPLPPGIVDETGAQADTLVITRRLSFEADPTALATAPSKPRRRH